jgi:hypothetical protein
MKTDLSRLFYELYFSNNNRLIEVTLKNGNIYKGVFISFFFGEEGSKDSFIIKWQIVEEKLKMSLGIDAFGYLIGDILNQKDISKIRYLNDNREFKF